MNIPRCDTTNPHALAAWFGRNGIAQHYRKVILAKAREMERGKAAARSEKITEARLDDLARDSSMYLDYLQFMAEGAEAYEQAWQEALMQRGAA